MHSVYLRVGWPWLLASALVFPACEAAAPESPGEGDAAEARQASSAVCYWQGASVTEGEWLECPSCVWRYCQCQPDGRWGYCTNDPPPDGACDWTHPDWTNPACSEGGRKPCDWTQPDWQNPACQDTAPPGGGQACLTCHPGGPPPGTPPPHIHTWL